MSYHLKTIAFQLLLFVCLLCSGADVDAQTGVPTPSAPTPSAPTKSKEASADSEPKVQNYKLKHAKAAEVLKLWKQLHEIGRAHV